ncbi:CocE/NonD family hydrolase [Streptomyces chitinivorans]|uniref:CocE/NonD family hydrolase n=1 Tax=Streptomyces chitinivorans TaxID=1257027 RepID=A0ABW7HLX6_9ACTN|nr:CocE/NonD family hydrolase [Streptomyces chitinivorans]MDH2410455.1 CocE/NonD family hydrolase [Streptomyces chitinivorans]
MSQDTEPGREPDPVAERRETTCALRDGTRLRTVLLVPHGSGPWPALLTRHPYDAARDEHEGMLDVRRLVAAGYLVALQDVRGRFGSEGVFDPCAQEVADGADAVAWLAALPECTGAVGMWGASYASDTQFSALLGGAPALRAIAPAMTPAMSALDGFRFRGGVPEIGSTLAWTHYAIAPDLIARIESAREREAERKRWEATERAIGSGEAFRAGALNACPDAEAIVVWGLDRLREPLGSARHRAGKIVDRIDAIDVPVFLIGGWFDVFLGSTLEIYRRLLRCAKDTGGPAPRLLIGPWTHDDMSGRTAGVDFGPGASAGDLGGSGDLTAQHVRWFDAALRAGPADVPPVRVFLMGSNRWIELEEFPPRGTRTLELYLGAGGSLAAEPAGSGERRLTSDPASPVPTCGGAVLLFAPFEAGPADQAAVEARRDVVSWRTVPLAEELTVMGAVRAVVRLTTTGTDADVVVRLCDEHPDGSSRVIADGVQRGSARLVDPVTGLGDRLPVEPDQEQEFAVDLWSTAHTFLPGHRVRVDIAPSSSPRWDVGRNVFEPAGAMRAGAMEAPTVAEYTIHHGAAHPSRLILQVVTAAPQ